MATDERGMLIPVIDDENAGFWEGTAAGELRVQRCMRCEHLRFPPRPMCPWCHSCHRQFVTVSGNGVIWSFVVAHPPLLPAYAALAPYNVVVVTLDEDPALRMVSNLVSRPGGPVNEVDPATIRIGEHVRAVFDPPNGAGIAMLRWMREAPVTGS